MHESKKRFRVASIGRQSGKSTWAVNELIKKAWENPNQTFWFLSPTFDQAKNMYRRLVGSLWNCNEIMLKKNQTELRVKFVNQSQIYFKSGETLDNLRGSTLHGAIIDEVRDQHAELWPMVIRPMLATTGGWAAFISTPNGFDQFYDLFEYARQNPEEWDTFQSPSTANPLITEKELEDARKTMSEAQFAQEYLAEFRDLTAGKAYINFSDANLRHESPLITGEKHGEIFNKNLPIIVAMDFNLSPMSWALGQKRIDSFYFFDEIWIKGSHTQEASKVLVDKIKSYNPSQGVILIGDATANAGQRASAGQSDYDIICQTLDQAGIKWINLTPDSNPTVKDRVNTMNSKLKDGNGQNHLFIHPTKCPMLKKDLDRVVWKTTSASDRIILDQTSNPDLTHISDAVGYAIYALSPLKYDQRSSTLHIIRR